MLAPPVMRARQAAARMRVAAWTRALIPPRWPSSAPQALASMRKHAEVACWRCGPGLPRPARPPGQPPLLALPARSPLHKRVGVRQGHASHLWRARPFPGPVCHTAAQRPRQRRLPGLLRGAQGPRVELLRLRNQGPVCAGGHGGGRYRRNPLLAGHLPRWARSPRPNACLGGVAGWPRAGRRAVCSLGQNGVWLAGWLSSWAAKHPRLAAHPWQRWPPPARLPAVDVIKSAMMTDSIDPKQRRYPSIPAAARALWAEGGLPRFYRGFSPCIMRAAPANAVMLFTVDKVGPVCTCGRGGGGGGGRRAAGGRGGGAPARSGVRKHPAPPRAYPVPVLEMWLCTARACWAGGVPQACRARQRRCPKAAASGWAGWQTRCAPVPPAPAGDPPFERVNLAINRQQCAAACPAPAWAGACCCRHSRVPRHALRLRREQPRFARLHARSHCTLFRRSATARNDPHAAVFLPARLRPLLAILCRVAQTNTPVPLPAAPCEAHTHADVALHVSPLTNPAHSLHFFHHLMLLPIFALRCWKKRESRLCNGGQHAGEGHCSVGSNGCNPCSPCICRARAKHLILGNPEHAVVVQALKHM